MIKKISLVRQKIRPLIVLTIKKLGLYEQAVAYKRKYFMPLKVENLSPWAQQVYQDIKTAQRKGKRINRK
jgi:hypothetical protein